VITEKIHSVELCIWNRSGGPGRLLIRQWPRGCEGTCLHVRKKSDVLVDSHAHQHLVAQSKQTLQYERNYITTNWNMAVTFNDTVCAWACSLETGISLRFRDGNSSYSACCEVEHRASVTLTRGTPRINHRHAQRALSIQ
jgi:hypothetical protein